MQHLVWSRDPEMTKMLYSYLSIFNPEVDEEELFISARNIQDYIGAVIVSQDRMTSIDGSIYYIGGLSDFSLRFVTRVGNRPEFPLSFIEAEGLKGNTDLFLTLLAKEIEDNLKFTLNADYSTTLEGEVFTISYVPVLESEFEKTFLGGFFYLLYLRDLFQRDPNVCVVVSPLDPLFAQARRVEIGLTLSKVEFVKSFPRFADEYSKLLRAYEELSAPLFRLVVLNSVLKSTGPYLTASTEKAVASNSFMRLLERCLASDARYTVAYVVLFLEDDSSHANILIFDKENRVVERFDPNGSVFVDDANYLAVSEKIDETLREITRGIGFSYLPPSEFCPRLGVQQFERFFKDTGFCVSWSLLYAEERLKSKVSREYFAENLMEDIIVSNPRLKAKTSEETFRNVETWLESRIDEIFTGMDAYYQQLSKQLGVNVSYRDRKLLLQ